MTWPTIPNTFSPNTKAVSSQANANFTALKDAISSYVQKTNTDYTITDIDGYRNIGFSTGNTARTATLPTAADNTNRVLTIFKLDSGTGTVTVDGEGAETINGSTTKVLVAQYDFITVQCDGSAWYVINGSPNVTLPSQSGNSGKVLQTDATKVSWASVLTDPTTTRGDLIRRNATVIERFAVGTVGQILRSDGTDPNWFTPPCASAYLSSSRTGLTSGSGYNIICNTEDFDAENYYDNATNYRYTPLVAGKYLVTLGVEIESTTADSLVDWGAYVLKNGTAYRAFGRTSIPSARPITRAGVTGSCIVDMNGSTDYLEVNGYGAVTGGGTYLIVGGNFTGSARYTWVSFSWIGK